MAGNEIRVSVPLPCERRTQDFFFATTVALLKIRTRLDYNLRPRSHTAHSKVSRSPRLPDAYRYCPRMQGYSLWVAAGTAIRLPEGSPPVRATPGVHLASVPAHTPHLCRALRSRFLLISGAQKTQSVSGYSASQGTKSTAYTQRHELLRGAPISGYCRHGGTCSGVGGVARPHSVSHTLPCPEEATTVQPPQSSSSSTISAHERSDRKRELPDAAPARSERPRQRGRRAGG